MNPEKKLEASELKVTNILLPLDMTEEGIELFDEAFISSTEVVGPS